MFPSTYNDLRVVDIRPAARDSIDTVGEVNDLSVSLRQRAYILLDQVERGCIGEGEYEGYDGEGLHLEILSKWFLGDGSWRAMRIGCCWYKLLGNGNPSYTVSRLCTCGQVHNYSSNIILRKV